MPVVNRPNHLGAGSNGNASVANRSNIMPPSLERGQNQNESLPIVPEAFLVESDSSDSEDDRVIIEAEPWLPWWKRKRFVGFLLLFAAGILAIAIGVGVYLGKQRTIVTEASESSPTISPSPTISFAPSSSPTECALTISSNIQKLDMPVDKPFETKIALDTNNAVVVTRESGTTNVHVIFYLKKGDQWQRGNQYILDYGLTYDESGKYADRGEYDPTYSKITVALSGKTAMVGFPFSAEDATSLDPNWVRPGVVFLFEQNTLGVWEKREHSITPPDEDSLFGYAIDINDNFACVIADGDVDDGNEYPKVYVFHKDEDDWKQIRRYGITSLQSDFLIMQLCSPFCLLITQT